MPRSLHSRRHHRRIQGMTLVEIMVATALSVAIIAAAVSFLVEVTRSTVKTTNNSSNDLASWDIYSQISIDSKVANGMVIYKDFTKPSFDPTVDPSTVRVTSGGRGDLLVLTRSEPSTTGSSSAIYNVVGFYVDKGTSTFKRFNLNLSPASTNSIEQILTNNYAALQTASSTMATSVTDTITNPSPTAPSTANPADPNTRAFLCRDQAAQSGVLNILLNASTGNLVNYKIVESAFVVRP